MIVEVVGDDVSKTFLQTKDHVSGNVKCIACQFCRFLIKSVLDVVFRHVCTDLFANYFWGSFLIALFVKRIHVYDDTKILAYHRRFQKLNFTFFDNFKKG